MMLQMPPFDSAPAKRQKVERTSSTGSNGTGSNGLTRTNSGSTPKPSPRHHIPIPMMAKAIDLVGVKPQYSLVSPRGPAAMLHSTGSKEEEHHDDSIWEHGKKRAAVRAKITDVFEEHADQSTTISTVKELLSRPITREVVRQLDHMSIGRDVLKGTDVGKILKDYESIAGVHELVEKWRAIVKHNIHLGFEIEGALFDKYSNVPQRESHGSNRESGPAPGTPSTAPATPNQSAGPTPNTPNSYGNMVVSSLLTREPSSFALVSPRGSVDRNSRGSNMGDDSTRASGRTTVRSGSEYHALGDRCITKDHNNGIWKYHQDLRTIISILKKPWNKSVKDDLSNKRMAAADFIQVFQMKPETYNSPDVKKMREQQLIQEEKNLAVSSDYPFFDANMVCPKCGNNGPDSDSNANLHAKNSGPGSGRPSSEDANDSTSASSSGSKSAKRPKIVKGCRYNVNFYDMWASYRGPDEGRGGRRVSAQCPQCGYQWQQED